MALAQSTDVGTGFVPLTNIPILTQTGNSFSLDQFLNGLYRICIGIAAVLAVLQIMRAGIMYMGGDSVTEKKEAKNLIAMAIGGLILVLSPVVVFSVINPEILTLKINNIENLRSTLTQEAIDETLWSDTSSSRADARARCEAQGGTPVFTCTPPGGTARVVPASQACAAGEDGITICRRNATTPPSDQACSAYSGFAVSATGVCNGANGYTQVSASCSAEKCGSLQSPAICCGLTPPPPPTTAEMYAWRGEYYTDSACAITPGAICQTQILKGGAYQTQAQCRREFETDTDGKVLKGSALCSCDYNIGSQSVAFCLGDL